MTDDLSNSWGLDWQQQTVVASPTTTAYEASRLMAERRVGAVAVLEQGGLVGIFTERDVLLDYQVMRERWHAAHSERLAVAA